MKKFILFIFFLLFALPSFAAEDLSSYSGTVYFQDDFEAGSAGDRWTHLGGLVSGPVATSCSDSTASYHHTYVSNDASGQSAVAGSSYSLKTPYRGACAGESSSRDMNTLSLATPVYEYYVRWYQKWTGDWNSGDVQHKFFKPATVYGSEEIWPGQTSFAPLTESWRLWIPNYDSHFDKDGYDILDTTSSVSWIWVTAKAPASNYNGSNNSYDDFNNGIGAGGTDDNFAFVPGQWYCIEIHAKVNSTSSTSDAEYDAWVDGVKIMHCEGFRYYTSGTRPAVQAFEFQHIYYIRTPTDQPTYMDNIVVGSSYIGPIGSDPAPAPPTLSNVTISGGSFR